MNHFALALQAAVNAYQPRAEHDRPELLEALLLEGAVAHREHLGCGLGACGFAAARRGAGAPPGGRGRGGAGRC